MLCGTVLKNNAANTIADAPLCHGAILRAKTMRDSLKIETNSSLSSGNIKKMLRTVMDISGQFLESFRYPS